MSEPIFNGYWLGYQPNGNTLDQTPSYVNKVTLFVAAPAIGGKTLGVNYLCKAYTQEQQIAWIRQLQAQGTEVLMSLMDTPKTSWSNVDIPTFVQNVKDTAIDGPWGLNGIDIDLESSMPSSVWAQTFTQLIQEFRKVLGPIGTVNSNGQNISRLSVAAYLPNSESPILKATGAQLDWLNTMAYGNGASSNESLFKTYQQWVQQVNMGVGVHYQDGLSTDLTQTGLMAQYAAATPNCGMMEFGLNNDCSFYTKQSQWTWANAINSGFNSSSRS